MAATIRTVGDEIFERNQEIKRLTKLCERYKLALEVIATNATDQDPQDIAEDTLNFDHKPQSGEGSVCPNTTTSPGIFNPYPND